MLGVGDRVKSHFHYENFAFFLLVRGSPLIFTISVGVSPKFEKVGVFVVGAKRPLPSAVAALAACWPLCIFLSEG